jgi:hypothetical protein
MSDSTETVSPSPAPAPAKRTRGPRAEVTKGTILSLHRVLGEAGLRSQVEAHKDDKVFMNAVRQAAADLDCLAEFAPAKIPDGGLLNKAGGAFISLRHLGGASGGAYKVRTEGDSVIVTLA